MTTRSPTTRSRAAVKNSTFNDEESHDEEGSAEKVLNDEEGLPPGPDEKLSTFSALPDEKWYDEE